MKKFLVLTLLLGIASLASAGVDLGDVDGLDYSIAGNTVTITGADVGGFQLAFKADDNSVLSNGDVDGHGIVWNSFAADGAWYGSIYEWAFSSGVSTTDKTGTLMTLDFSPTASKLYIAYSSYAGDSYVSVGGATTQLGGLYEIAIPEPMTMSLLGLGSLFLVRRKKA